MKSSEMERVIAKASVDEWVYLHNSMREQDSSKHLVYLMATVSCKLTALNALLSLLFVEIEQDEEE